MLILFLGGSSGVVGGHSDLFCHKLVEELVFVFKFLKGNPQMVNIFSFFFLLFLFNYLADLLVVLFLLLLLVIDLIHDDLLQLT